MTELIDCVQWCGVRTPLRVTDRRITPKEYQERISSTPHLLIDCRPRNQFAMGSISPYAQNYERLDKILLAEIEAAALPVYVICRRGNDSQLMVNQLTEQGISAWDIIGGITAWRTAYPEHNLPDY